MIWPFLSGLILIAFGYPLGAVVARTVPDELVAHKYILLLRDAVFLMAVALAAYEFAILRYVIPLIIILSYIWFWESYELLYPWLYPIVLYFGFDLFVTVVALLFVGTFVSGALSYEKLTSWKDYKRYAPYAISSFLFLIVALL